MSVRAKSEDQEDLTDRRRHGEIESVESAHDSHGAIREWNDGFDMIAIRALAEQVFGDRSKAEAWLRRPNASMSGQIPLDLLNDAPGMAVVRETLEQINDGIFA